MQFTVFATKIVKEKGDMVFPVDGANHLNIFLKRRYYIYLLSQFAIVGLIVV
jgi:hypothetical protein